MALSESLTNNPLYIGTIEYSATGEGSTFIVYATRSTTQTEFVRKLINAHGAFYVMSAEIFVNEVPKNLAWRLSLVVLYYNTRASVEQYI